ncbi:hypothetical protein ScPMuIL_008204 [Solemya velum]
MDIAKYLIHTVSAYTFDELRSKKSLEAYNYFLCGWVQDIRHATIEDRCVFTARVRHSQRTTDPFLVPWLIAEKSGCVLCGHCTCMAGLGEVCSHVSALLFAIEATVRLRNSKTVTQEKSYWLLPSAIKKVNYKTIQEIDFTSAKTKKRKLDCALKTGDTPAPLKKRKLPDVTVPTTDELNNLYSNLHQLKSKGKKPVILSLLPNYAKEFRPASLDKKYPLVLSELYDEDFINAKLSVSEEEAHNCELDTRTQSKSKQWFRLRAGRITASKIKAACKTSLEKPSMSLIRDICYPMTRTFSSASTQWGCQHEKTAREQYQREMEVLHENFVVRDSGLVINPKYPFLGATPDGVASCQCCGDVILEIKCPYCQRDKSVSDEIDCLEEKDGQLRLKRSHSYYYQVQCQLLLSNVECSDFVVWTQKDFFTERIKFDDMFCDQMVTQASLLFKDVVLHELVGKLYSKPKLVSMNVNTNTNQTKDSMIICTCKTLYNEGDADVIGCDAETCPYKWLHFSCAKIKRFRKANGFATSVKVN